MSVSGGTIAHTFEASESFARSPVDLICAAGALVAGADRFVCDCGSTDCPAGRTPGASATVFQVIAAQAAIDGTGDASGSAVGVDGLIPTELVRQLAKSGYDVSVSELRPARGGMRSRPYDSVWSGRAHARVQSHVRLPKRPLLTTLYGPIGVPPIPAVTPADSTTSLAMAGPKHARKPPGRSPIAATF